jgi:hypothetical protein
MGIPPVKKVTLMCYNLIQPFAQKGKNSILDTQELESYLTADSKYPLHLDIVLPIYSWGFHYQYDKFSGFFDCKAKDLDEFCVKKSDLWYEVSNDTTINDVYFRIGDKIKYESVSKEVINRTISILKSRVDFDNTASWSPLVKGDVLFSALGTTLKVAKTKDNQFKIDYTYQYQVAKAASDNGVNTYVLVSSYGANENSAFFYPQTKGKLDADVQKLSFKQIHIFRPGILQRQASKLRPVEKISIHIINALNKLGLLMKQKPMPVKVLAEKMILVAKKQDVVNTQIHNLNTIFSI